jgi:hypothetical protein
MQYVAYKFDGRLILDISGIIGDPILIDCARALHVTPPAEVHTVDKNLTQSILTILDFDEDKRDSLFDVGLEDIPEFIALVLSADAHQVKLEELAEIPGTIAEEMKTSNISITSGKKSAVGCGLGPT